MNIGANIGLYSMSFTAYGYEVFSFEASQDNIEQLRISTAANCFDIELIDKAVVDKSGIYNFVNFGTFGFLV